MEQKNALIRFRELLSSPRFIMCHYITAAVRIPVFVDAGAGFGEPLHVMRTVRELERTGIAGLHIEDQIYPKRVHYHKGVEHIVSRDEMVMIFPNSLEEARRAPREIKGPVTYVNSEGNRLNRPLFSVKEFEDMGYKMATYPTALLCPVTQELKRVITNLKTHGASGLPQDKMIVWRKEVEDLIGLDEYYRIESETVER